jgi:hypothetical protein
MEREKHLGTCISEGLSCPAANRKSAALLAPTDRLPTTTLKRNCCLSNCSRFASRFQTVTTLLRLLSKTINSNLLGF